MSVTKPSLILKFELFYRFLNVPPIIICQSDRKNSISKHGQMSLLNLFVLNLPRHFFVIETCPKSFDMGPLYFFLRLLFLSVSSASTSKALKTSASASVTRMTLLKPPTPSSTVGSNGWCIHTPSTLNLYFNKIEQLK
jgi:hypothetical protein